MSDYDEEKLAEDINEFDRLMSAHDTDESTTDPSRDPVIFDDVKAILGDAKPDFDINDTDHGGIELVHLPVPVPHEQEKTEETAVVGRVTSVAGRIYKLVKSEVGLITILLTYSFLGAVIFHHAEFEREQQIHQLLAEHKRRCVADIVNASVASYPARSDAGRLDFDDEWYGNLSRAVETLVDVYVEHKEQLRPLSRAPEWSYWGALFFCGTVFTTVGYGYIYPVTTIGRVMTMIYALIGIPLCLVVLAGLGKSLTRAIKFLWSFIRRFYYTGSFRRVRRVIPLSRVRLTLGQRLFNRLRRSLLTRRRRQTIRAARKTTEVNGVESAVVAAVDAELQCLRELDETFVPYEVDDKFDLPPIVALIIAFLYILLGAFIYTSWEDWSYFEAFYFTFISLSTIGFGDVVPEHPKNLMATSVYLLFGLALIAMVVNVVMEAVNSTIAKAKDGVYGVGRKLVDVAQRQTIISLQHTAPAAGTEHHMPPWVSGVGAVAAWPSNRRRSI